MDEIYMPITNLAYSTSYQKFIIGRMDSGVQCFNSRGEHENSERYKNYCLDIVRNVLISIYLAEI
jgi:hypothetical protein